MHCLAMSGERCLGVSWAGVKPAAYCEVDEEPLAWTVGSAVCLGGLSKHCEKQKGHVALVDPVSILEGHLNCY